MRIGSASALVLAAFALAACEGSPTTGSSASNATLDLCGLACPFGNPTSGTNVVNDESDGDDSSTDGGNTSDLSPLTADTTIALESSRLVTPSGNIPSLSLLTAGTSPTTTTAQILSGTKPTQLTIAVDTNSGTNAAWPTPAQMDQYDYGTQDITWYRLGHYVTTATIVDSSSVPVGSWDPVSQRYEFTSTGNAIDMRDPFYAAQIMDSRANGGAGTDYREYRVYSTKVGQERDESLQVWAWGDSYATQYRVTPSGGEAAQQAWSFGGNKTPLVDMPTTGSATYNGRFVATAKTANYLKPSGAFIDPNALWRVQGASQVTANFGPSGTVSGTLTPETWTSFQSGLSGGTYVKTVGVDPILPNTLIEMPDYSFYYTTVALSGAITGNTYAGEANLSGAYISGDQTMYGGFFGATGAETTGVFHVTGMDPDPIGGSAGINDDKRGYLTMQGAFHGTNP